MPELWTDLPVEIQAAILTVVLWALDALATRTPNPFDNLLVRGLRALRDRKSQHGS